MKYTYLGSSQWKPANSNLNEIIDRFLSFLVIFLSTVSKKYTEKLWVQGVRPFGGGRGPKRKNRSQNFQQDCLKRLRGSASQQSPRHGSNQDWRGSGRAGSFFYGASMRITRGLISSVSNTLRCFFFYVFCVTHGTALLWGTAMHERLNVNAMEASCVLNSVLNFCDEIGQFDENVFRT